MLTVAIFPLSFCSKHAHKPSPNPSFSSIPFLVLRKRPPRAVLVYAQTPSTSMQTRPNICEDHLSVSQEWRNGDVSREPERVVPGRFIRCQAGPTAGSLDVSLRIFWVPAERPLCLRTSSRTCGRAWEQGRVKDQIQISHLDCASLFGLRYRSRT